MRRVRDVRKANGIKRWDWLLIIGLTLAPMTGLRVWKVGPAEVLCLIWGLRYFPKRIVRLSDTLRFFVLFLLSLAVGSVFGYFIAPEELSNSGLLTWSYLAFIAVAVYEGLSTYDIDYVERMLLTFSRTATLWYLFLYFYSIYVNKSFFGAPLWYHGVRFTGGATNPHQVACMVCGLFFVSLREAFKTKQWIKSLAPAAGCIYILIQTEASTGYMAIAIGIMIAVYFRVSEAFPGKRHMVLILEVLIVIVAVLIFYRPIFNAVSRWIESDQNGEGRLAILSSIGTTFWKSPLFGLGPGTHGRDGTIEFHNTYFEIIAAAGIVGMIIFLSFTIRIVSKSYSDTSLIPVIAAMYAYGLAGFAMRRLVYWGILTFVLVIAEKIRAAEREADRACV